MKYRYLILGGGPAGLSFANRLQQLGETSFLLLEKEKEAGGLCRSANVDEAPIDIGGGHFLDTTRPLVNEFLFEFMPQEEWNRFTRNSLIQLLSGEMVHHPLESNIWEMDIEQQIAYIKSIAVAGCNLQTQKPEAFVPWIYWKLGDRIAEDYMIPYNLKMFGQELEELGTYWLEKLPNVSLDETLRSCLQHQAHGTQPGHAAFYYPKCYGYGELWKRMSEKIASHIVYEAGVQSIDFNSRTVKTRDGQEYQADIIITTIPWCEFKEIQGMPLLLKQSISKLKYTPVQIEYHDDNINNDAHWIYYPNQTLRYHRILVRHNFCPNSKGYWTETNTQLSTRQEEHKNGVFYNEYAYPLNTIEKPDIVEELLTYTRSKQVFGLGRWGEHQHYNSDVTVEKALQLCEKMVRGSESE